MKYKIKVTEKVYNKIDEYSKEMNEILDLEGGGHKLSKCIHEIECYFSALYDSGTISEEEFDLVHHIGSNDFNISRFVMKGVSSDDYVASEKKILFRFLPEMKKRFDMIQYRVEEGDKDIARLVCSLLKNEIYELCIDLFLNNKEEN